LDHKRECEIKRRIKEHLRCADALLLVGSYAMPGRSVYEWIQTDGGVDAGMASLFGKALPPGFRMTDRYGDGYFFIRLQ